jgi:DNA-binding NarL/FixJ family response regulator
MPLRFLIVEDHPIFAEALQLIIGSAFPNSSSLHVSSLRAAIASMERGEEFDLALLDLWLPDTQAFEGLIALRQRYFKLPIVVVSAFADPLIVHKSLLCGAAGFIPKSAARDTIVQAIRDVLAGGVALAGNGNGAPVDTAAVELPTFNLSSLTKQQLRVLQMLCQGLLNKQIAYALNVGETTIKAHVSEILRKLGVSSRTQAVLELSKLGTRIGPRAFSSPGANGDVEDVVRRAASNQKQVPNSEKADV